MGCGLDLNKESKAHFVVKCLLMLVKMHFSESEIIELGIRQLTSDEIKRALEAMNDLGDTFGKNWVEQHFQGARAPAFVRALVSIWEDWLLVRNMHGNESIKKRWMSGIHEQGVATELFIIASLIPCGA